MIKLSAFCVLCCCAVLFPQTKFPKDTPISPKIYRGQLHRGMDVGWSEFKIRNAAYTPSLVTLIKNGGFDHLRFRTDLPADTAVLNSLDKQIEDCLDNGMTPIIACKASTLKLNPNEENQIAFIDWWKIIAERYQNYTHRLSFDLIVEVSDSLSNVPDTLNSIFEKTISEIRKTNPTRNIFISPIKLSNPNYLSLLTIPSGADGYLLGEWHFYAAGPSKTSSSKLWTTGTPDEKALITNKIVSASSWEKSTGIPTWVGAWMPGNYNDSNYYSIPEQVQFSSFFVRELEQAGIPWAVNAENQFTDYLLGLVQWTQPRIPVKDVITDPWRVSLYTGTNYSGKDIRLSPGSYNIDSLQNLDLVDNIRSFMIPADYTLTLFSESDFTGSSSFFSATDSVFEFTTVLGHIRSLRIDNLLAGFVENGKINFLNFSMSQNYPNPFNPLTTIAYTLPERTDVTISIYNQLGQKVATLFNGTKEVGQHSVVWNAANMSSGIYFYELKTEKFSSVKKLMLMK